MTPDLRRGLAALLAGIAASLVGLMTASWLRQRACVGAGGDWLEGLRACALPGGLPEPSPWRSSLAGAAAAVVTLVVLWRTYTFFADRGRRPG